MNMMRTVSSQKPSDDLIATGPSFCGSNHAEVRDGFL